VIIGTLKIRPPDSRQIDWFSIDFLNDCFYTYLSISDFLEGRSMLERAARVERRFFVGGSDARIIMGNAKTRCSGFGGKSAARSSHRTCPAT
jgi:hypothetical protein